MSYLEFIVACFVICIIMLTGSIYPQTAEELYQKGVQYEEVKGELNKAIESYEAVLVKASSARKTAALAQLHMGMCYEKMGRDYLGKAIENYQQVVVKFSDQKEVLRVAEEKLAGYDNSEEDIIEVKQTIADYYQALQDKDANRVVSFHSKNYYDNQLWGKTGNKTADEEFKDWLNEDYFNKWDKITFNFNIKSVNKEGFNYVAFIDFDVVVSEGNQKDITITRAMDFPYLVSKENGKWKINLRKDKSPRERVPDSYNTLGKVEFENGAPGLIYVSHISECSVTVLEPKKRKIVDQILSHYGSTSVEYSPDNKNGYITNYFSNEITLFDKKSSREIVNIPVGKHPSNMLVMPDGYSMIVMHESEDGMWVLSTSNNQVIRKNPEITGIIGLHPGEQKIYISAIFKPYVYVLNPSNQSVEKTIEVGGRPMNLAFTADGRYVYISNYDLNEVEKIDTQTDSVVNRIAGVNNARGIAVTKDNRYLFVTNVVANTITVINPADDSIVKVIPVDNAPTSVAVSLDNMYAYVTNQGSATLSVIDINRLAVVQTIKVLDNPITVQVDE